MGESTAARVIGLTGGIGSGKSTVAAILREAGATVIDADAIAREVVAVGEPALAEIRARFGPSVLHPSGELDRAALAAVVFSDPDARTDLETITHPRISERAREQMEAARRAGARVIVYEAALIVEKGLHHGMDALVVVAVDPDVQVQRVMARDDCSAEDARARIGAQLPLAHKVVVADYIINNSGTREETRRQVDRLWRELRDG